MSKNATMFNNAFVNSGRFLMLPPSTKLLYFYLLKDADDDGIVDGYATIRILNAEITDWTSLIERRFVLLLDEPFLGFLPDYILHNQNFDLRYKKDSRYLPLLAEKFPAAQVQVGIKNGKGKIEKCVMKVSEYLNYSQKSQQKQLLMQKAQNTRDSQENPRFPTANITQHNKTKANTNKENVTQLNISQQNLIEQKSSSSELTQTLQQQQHSNVAAVRANTDDEKEFTPPSLQEVDSYCKEKNLQIDANAFLQEYKKRKWISNAGKKIKNWKAVLYSYAMTHSFTTICTFDFFFKIAVDKLHMKADKAKILYEYAVRAGITTEDVLNYYNKATSSNIDNPVGWFVQAIKEAY